MKYGRFLICFFLLHIFLTSCGEDPKYKEFFPGENGEKPKEFIYAFSKDYELTSEKALEFLEKIRIFAKKQNMYEYSSRKVQGENFNVYFVAGPPMKYLLRVERLSGSSYRVQISCYPQKECKLCETFILEIDSKI